MTHQNPLWLWLWVRPLPLAWVVPQPPDSLQLSQSPGICPSLGPKVSFEELKPKSLPPTLAFNSPHARVYS